MSVPPTDNNRYDGHDQGDCAEKKEKHPSSSLVNGFGHLVTKDWHGSFPSVETLRRNRSQSILS